MQNLRIVCRIKEVPFAEIDRCIELVNLADRQADDGIDLFNGKSLPSTYIEFLPAHLHEVFTFLLFALLIGLLLKKAGFAIVLTGIYTLIVEPILTISLPQSWEPFFRWLPIRVINDLIHFPFNKYIFQEVQDFVSWQELGIVLFRAVFLVGLNYFTLQKRDIKE